MRYITSCLLTLVVVVACSKDTVETKPSIKVTKVNSTEIPLGGALNIDLDFTDKEGDLQSIFVQKVRINKKTVATIRDSFTLNVADFPKEDHGTLQINLDYQNQLISAQAPPSQSTSPTGFEPDSLVIRMALKDKADHVSDTITTETIIVQRKN